MGQSQVWGIGPGLGRCNKELTGSLSKGLEACWEFAKSCSRVSEACREFVGSLPKEIESLQGWHQGFRRKKTERLTGRSSGVVEKLAGS
ncbi:hypothetical protein GW17_00006084 [Ensete ventricosum]|nr:hypothetical protein GW17_00006084 [Ensete ventricosum]